MPIKGPAVAGRARRGRFPLHADAIGGHKLGVSRRAEHVRPDLRALLRLQLQGSPTAKRDAKTMSPDELKALEQEEAQSSDDEDARDKDPEAAAAAVPRSTRGGYLPEDEETQQLRAAQMERPSAPPPSPSQTRMLKVQLYQARGCLLRTRTADRTRSRAGSKRCG